MTVMTGLLDRLRKPRKKQWNLNDRDLPWFDQPNALEILEQRRKAGRYDDAQYSLLRKWVEDGYVMCDGLVPMSDIDGMIADMENLWTTDQAIPGVRIEDLRLNPDDPAAMEHERLVKLDLPTRMRVRHSSRWRVHGFWSHSAAGKAIFQNPKLAELASLIFDRPALPQYTINFMYGSEQHLHQDMAVFHIVPKNYLIGAWVACEDISPDSGALVYHPGSHKERMFSGFPNYPQDNLRTCDKPTKMAYEAWLDQLGKQSRPAELFVAKKGQVLLWHGMLLHGGAPVRNPDLTRKSYVIHYIPDGMNVQQEIVGPFNW